MQMLKENNLVHRLTIMSLLNYSVLLDRGADKVDCRVYHGLEAVHFLLQVHFAVSSVLLALNNALLENILLVTLVEAKRSWRYPR